MKDSFYYKSAMEDPPKDQEDRWADVPRGSSLGTLEGDIAPLPKSSPIRPDSQDLLSLNLMTVLQGINGRAGFSTDIGTKMVPDTQMGRDLNVKKLLNCLCDF